MTVWENIQNRYKALVAFVILLLANGALFWNTLRVGFLSDDYHALQIARDMPNVLSFFGTNIIGTTTGSSYGPMWNLAMWLEYTLFGLWAPGYHLVSILLTTVVAWLIYMILRHFDVHVLLALGVTLFFSVLPGHSEAVAWVAAQVHLIAALWYVLAAYLYFLFVRTKKQPYYWSAVAVAALSFFTKEVGITVVGVFLLIELFFATSSLTAIIKRLAAPVGVLVLYLLLRANATGVFVGYYGASSAAVPLKQMLTMAIELPLSFFFSDPLRSRVTEVVLSNLLFVGIALVALLYMLSRHKRVRALFFFLCVSIVASLPFLFLQFSAVTDEGERYGYLLSVFFFLAIGIYFAGFNAKRWSAVVVSLVVGVLAASLIPALLEKNARWVHASTIASSLYEEAIQYIDPTFEGTYYLIGLPDTFEGAQVARNGFAQALDFLHGIEADNIERVLQMVRLREENRDDQRLLVEQVDAHQYQLTPAEDRSLTGLPVVERDGVTFMLDGFALPVHDADAVIVHIDQSKAEEIRILYYTNGTLQRL